MEEGVEIFMLIVLTIFSGIINLKLSVTSLINQFRSRNWNFWLYCM